MGRVIDNFFQGALCVWRGLIAYASKPRLWRFAAIPTALVTILYAAIAYGLCTVAWPALRDYLNQLLTAPWIAWASGFLTGLVGLLAGLTLVVLLALFLSTVFEAVGGPFFASMVRSYEQQTYQCLAAPESSLLRDCRNTAACVVYAINTCMLAALLYVLSFPFPGTAHLAAILLLGFRYGIGYASEAAFNQNWTLSQLSRHFPHRKACLYGFGVAVFFILLVPVLSILAIPSLFIGGTILVHDFSDCKKGR